MQLFGTKGGTEVPSLSRDKGTTGQAENLAMGQNGPGQLLSKFVAQNWVKYIEAAAFNGAPKVYQLF